MGDGTCVLFNPKAGSAESPTEVGDSEAIGTTRPASRHRAAALASVAGGWTDRLGRWVEIPAAGDGGRIAREALDEGAERLIIAGGDGTVHEVVAGLLRSGRAVPLGILPLGTGNDFARTLGLPLDASVAIEVLERAARIRWLDAISVSMEAGIEYGVNVAGGGFGGDVRRGRVPDAESLPGFVSYFAGAVSALHELRARSTAFVWEDGSKEEVEAVAVVIANGRTAAGGVPVAPRANPEDGLLDVVAITDASPSQLARVGASLIAGDYTAVDSVFHRRVRRVRIASDPPMPFSLDGEPIPEAAALTFEVMPRALAWIVGPEYRASVPS